MSIWYIPASFIVTIVISHIIKEALHIWHHKEFSWYTLLMMTGGMPSSHSGAVTALSGAIFLQEGFSTLFWVAGLFSLIVIRDAFGVRQSVGEQAKLLNALSGKMQSEKKVAVVLGHTPLQVTAGVFLGLVVSIALYFVF